MTNENTGTALITGASTGIGAVYADRLAKRGYNLILVARNQQKLSEVSARIKDETGRMVEMLVADLSDTADLRRVEARLKIDTDITMLVNNAGVGSMSPVLSAWLSAEPNSVGPSRPRVGCRQRSSASKLSRRPSSAVMGW